MAVAKGTKPSPRGSGASGDDMDSRVSRLEAYMEATRDDLREIRSDMREIRVDLKAVIAKLGAMPTKSDLDNWKWQWLLASVAIFAVIIGSIIGGLSWLTH
jgi:hypothetical protein